MDQASGLSAYLQAILVIFDIEKAEPAQLVLDSVPMNRSHRLQLKHGQRNPGKRTFRSSISAVGTTIFFHVCVCAHYLNAIPITQDQCCFYGQPASA